MAFGIYVHIPYCLQICPYCDFTKYELGKIMPPASYVNLLKKEIRDRAGDVPSLDVDSIYFGGGTPSLLDPPLILTILDELAKEGFRWRVDAEKTIEIDPATVDEDRLRAYLDIGINRFSVGAQTFNSRLLTLAGRKHTASDTVALLTLLKRNNVNYSFDLLFALPSQTLAELRADVATAVSFSPSHLSAYCLTVPEGHPMSHGRAPDEEQVEMFDVIENDLRSAGVLRYEVSNFARPGFESRHNMLYWTDHAYWGLGTGSHSYFPKSGPWGMRFWNAPSLSLYERQITSPQPAEQPGAADWQFIRDLPDKQREVLEKHQALTDFCHTSLRMVNGLSSNALRLKFGRAIEERVGALLIDLENSKLVSFADDGNRGKWAMTPTGRVLANQIFAHLTFLEDELKSE